MEIVCSILSPPWWCNQIETFCMLLVLYAGNSPVTREFPSQRPVTVSSDVFFDLHLNKGWVNNRDASDLRHHHTHYDITIMWVVFGPNIKWIYHIGVELQRRHGMWNWDGHTDWYMERRTDRQNRQTHRQTDTHTDKAIILLLASAKWVTPNQWYYYIS